MGLLDNMLGGGAGMLGRGGRGMSPLTMALLGTLAYRTLKGKGRLADILGTGAAQNPAQPTANPLSASAISEGLGNLLNRFRQNGHGHEAESWVSTGANAQMSPQDLETALGQERVSWLMQQTGLSRDELLSGLSQSLPAAVDTLTPDGRLPSEHEVRRLM